MKYLVTGGCGFIGVNFAERLLARGDRVVLLDNLSRKGTALNLEYIKKLYPQVEFVHADIRCDNEKMQRAVENVDVVFHLAGQVAVTTSVTDPREDFDINALGTFNLLEAVRKSQSKPALLYASTNKVYGGMEDLKIVERNNRYDYDHLPLGVSENMLLDFHSPYGCSKGMADQYVRDYSRIYGLKTAVLRQSCIYGTRQFGIEDQGWVAWFTIASTLNKKISIYGDGKQVRDVLFVDDLFDAWDLCVQNIDQSKGQIYNVGGGRKYTLSLLELLSFLEDFHGKKIEYDFADWRPGDQPVYISDINKIKKDLGWEPKISVANGVKTLHRWVVENKNLFT